MGDSAAMEKHFVFDKNLTEADTLLLQNLLGDFKDHRAWQDGNLLPASDVDGTCCPSPCPAGSPRAPVLIN